MRFVLISSLHPPSSCFSQAEQQGRGGGFMCVHPQRPSLPLWGLPWATHWVAQSITPRDASYLQAVCSKRASLLCLVGDRCGCCHRGIAVALHLYTRKEKQKKSFLKQSIRIKKPKHKQPLSSGSGSPVRRPHNPASVRGPGMGNEPSPIPSPGLVLLLAFQMVLWQCGCWLLGNKASHKKKVNHRRGK